MSTSGASVAKKERFSRAVSTLSARSKLTVHNNQHISTAQTQGSCSEKKVNNTKHNTKHKTHMYLAGLAPIISDHEEFPRVLVLVAVAAPSGDLLYLHHLPGARCPSGVSSSRRLSRQSSGGGSRSSTEGLGPVAEIGKRGGYVDRLEGLRDRPGVAGLGVLLWRWWAGLMVTGGRWCFYGVCATEEKGTGDTSISTLSLCHTGELATTRRRHSAKKEQL